jgi:hypothetical protein
MSNRFPADDEHLHPYPGNLKHHKVDKAQQPVKVLTDEEIERIQDEDHAEAERNGEFDRDCYKDDEIYQIYMERSHAWTEGKRDGLRYARDNGYLAPSEGLTVEEVMIALQDHCLLELNGDTPSFFFHRFRARLTAAINAKQKP